jgi:hypothetical protein
MQSLVPRLVDPQQTRFVKGRLIYDNILTLCLVQEKAAASKLPVAMLQLDFQKAYDRVDHPFLWRVLHSMGIAPHFISLIQALVQGSAAKVHFNGLFTPKFALGRGVRQGCPLAPLLFAISTQPLMLLLQEKLQTGLDIGAPQRLLYQLFADDTGLFLKLERRTSNRSWKLFSTMSVSLALR